MSRSLLVGLLLAAAPVAMAQPAPPVPTQPQPPSPPVAPTEPPKDPRQGDTPGQKSPAPVTGTVPATTPTPPVAAATPAPKTIDDLTKGYTKTEGLFTLYRKVENNRQRFLMEVKNSQIGPLFMLQSTYASGNGSRVTAGQPARDIVWRFTRTDDNRLILTVPNLWYRSTDPNLKNAVERDFPDAYLDVYSIQASNKERGTVLIDMTSLFAGGVTGLNTAFQADGPLAALLGTYALDPELTYIERIKNFPTNMVVEGNYHFKRLGSGGRGSLADTQADPRSLPIKVTYNLYALPEGGYKPRLADPRVGFFINGQLSAGRVGFSSLDDDATADARIVYINRWNLQKANPSAKLSDPVKPITFYLDNSIPTRYRQAVREGLESWNKAFEPLGFRNAIVVKDAPANDWDTADMRYNTIRWIATPPASGASAVALLRENPVTGEIINAGINVQANWARIGYLQKEEDINPRGGARQDGILSLLQSKAKAHDHDHEVEQGGVACELSNEFIAQMNMGREVQQAMGLPLDDKTYVNDLLREVVAHEFGHVLGLRHNFIASTFLTPAQLANPAIVKAQGTTASVMDYVGYNAFGLKTGVPLFSTGPGKYDKWAISYGYTPINAASAKAEKPTLNRIARRSNEPGLAFQSDELADSLDPTVVRYDLSSDPIGYSEKSLDVTRTLLNTLGQRRPKTGDTYATFTQRLRSLIRANNKDAVLLSRFVGGVANYRVIKGAEDGRVPFKVIPIEQQRRALRVLTTRILAPNAFTIPTAYLNRTAPDPYDDDIAADNAFPLRDEIAAVRLATLASMFSPDRLNRIANTTWKFPGKTIAFPELFSSVRTGVWGPLAPTATFSAEQRDLARAHLAILIAMATDQTQAPADAELTAYTELQTLKAKLVGPRTTSPDAFSRAFIADSIRRIDNVLLKKPGS